MEGGGKNKIDLVYPELSYCIIGASFDVFNEMGYGHQEKYYEKALAKIFRKRGINFQEQVMGKVSFDGENVGRYYLDFLVENKIVIELKRGDRFLRSNINQVVAYLKTFNLKLGILINFTSTGVKYKRILNIK